MCGVHRPDVTTIEQSTVVMSDLEKSLLENANQDISSSNDSEE